MEDHTDWCAFYDQVLGALPTEKQGLKIIPDFTAVLCHNPGNDLEV